MTRGGPAPPSPRQDAHRNYARRVRTRVSTPVLLLALGAGALAAADALASDDAEALARGDAAWEQRAEGADDDGRAAPAPIEEAIRAYDQAVAAAPESLEARWKLLRALHFAADFASASEEAARARLDRATALADASRPLLGTASPRDAAATHFWSAIVWGAWSQRRGLLAAVREGVANRMHEEALAVVALDDRFEEGGAHRLLSRLHASLPRVPLLSGWVDRAQALPESERALAIAPLHLGNRYLFALTLLDVAPERREEALRVLEEVAVAEPRQDQRVEELSIRRSARERLAQERAETP